MARGLTLAEVERMRRERLRSVLLFLTDRCPVGCAHCSVDSRRDSPTIRDRDLFEGLVDAIAAQDRVRLVGISGGEPFVERRGLELAVDRLGAAGKLLVLYTSGVWAGSRVPGWVERVLTAASSVFLSTDGYHAAVLADDRFVNAARAVRRLDVPLVVQVIREPRMLEAAERLLERALGPRWSDEVELSLTRPLPYGRGAAVFHERARTLGRDFGACPALAAPVIRYDGRVTACCNERVIMGAGPERLRATCSSGDDVDAALAGFGRDPLLAAIGSAGPGPLTEHPRFGDLGDELYPSICHLCWRVLERAADEQEPVDRLARATAELAGSVPR